MHPAQIIHNSFSYTILYELDGNFKFKMLTFNIVQILYLKYNNAQLEVQLSVSNERFFMMYSAQTIHNSFSYTILYERNGDSKFKIWSRHHTCTE